MKTPSTLLLSAVLLCACSSGPEPAVRPPIPGHGPMQDAPRSAPAARATAPNEAATDEFLRVESERTRRLEPPPPEPEVRYVDREVYVQAPPRYRDYENRRRSPRFPWNTAFGAGIGAIIGHQSGHRDEGAAVGATIGLLIDATTWR